LIVALAGIVSHRIELRIGRYIVHARKGLQPSAVVA